MRKWILIAIIFATISNGFSQVLKESKAKIDNIDFELVDNNVVITYDLVNASKDERFDITVEIFKATTDVKIDAKTFSGDIYNQPPGKGKTILWELGQDISYLDDNIYILLDARHLNPITIPYSSKKKAYLQSTAFPGWGTSTITMNKYHLSKGVLAYSLVGLSIKSNIDASSYYDNYKNAEDADLRDEYFEKAEKSYQNSFIYFGGAAAVWLGEYLWIYLSPNKTDAMEATRNKLSFQYNYNTQFEAPVFTLTYNF